jgi:hypothetical protein
MVSEETEFTKLRANIDKTLASMHVLTLAIVDQLKLERDLSDRLAEVIWLLGGQETVDEERHDELISSSLDMYRQYRKWRQASD